MNRWLVCLGACALFARPLPARGAEFLDRQGFTLELGIGGSLVHLRPESHASANQLGDALFVGAGIFLTQKSAVLLHFAGISCEPEGDHGSRDEVSLWFIGPMFQHWFSDRFFLSGGPGYAYHDRTSRAYYGTSVQSSSHSVGLSIRTGYSVGRWKHHTLKIALEVVPAFFEDATVVSEVLSVDWQWL